MSDEIKHECGLLYTAEETILYYLQKYGTVMYGVKLYLLMLENSTTGGQDGAGIAAVKLNAELAHPFCTVCGAMHNNIIADIFL